MHSLWRVSDAAFPFPFALALIILAVHVSPDGTTVVALMSDSRLLVIKDIKRVIKGEVNFKESALIIHLSCPEHSTVTADSSAIYLAFEFGRVGVITVRDGDV